MIVQFITPGREAFVLNVRNIVTTAQMQSTVLNVVVSSLWTAMVAANVLETII
jgi:hypothetical protein